MTPTTFNIPVPWPPGFETVACATFEIDGLKGAILALNVPPECVRDAVAPWECREFTTGRVIARGRTAWDAYERALGVVEDHGCEQFWRQVRVWAERGLSLNTFRA
jgi:hypothetical protein